MLSDDELMQRQGCAAFLLMLGHFFEVVALCWQERDTQLEHRD